MLFAGLFEFLSHNVAVSAIIAQDPNGGAAIYQDLATKMPPRPCLVIHLVTSQPAGVTLDGSSGLRTARIQFDSYADDAPTARNLSQTIRAQLEDYNGGLPDGTVFTGLGTYADFDDPYEVAGIGYVFRAVLDIAAQYLEPGT